MASDPKGWKVGLVGYGEVGRILSEDLRKAGVAVAAYDIKLDDDRAPPLRDHAADIGVRLARSHADLAGQADLIVSAVTASQAVPVGCPQITSADVKCFVPATDAVLAFGEYAEFAQPPRSLG